MPLILLFQRTVYTRHSRSVQPNYLDSVLGAFALKIALPGEIFPKIRKVVAPENPRLNQKKSVINRFSRRVSTFTAFGEWEGKAGNPLTIFGAHVRPKLLAPRGAQSCRLPSPGGSAVSPSENSRYLHLSAPGVERR